MIMNVQPFVALVFAASVLSAQALPTLTKGARVRVTLASESGQPARQVNGTLARLADDTVVIARDNLPSVAISLGGGAQLEMDRSAAHARTGALIGVILGVVVANVWFQSCGPCSGLLPSPIILLPSAGLGLLIGVGVGGVIRSAWVRVPTAGVRIVSNPTSVGFTLSF
jgi:hypothetical protein